MSIGPFWVGDRPTVPVEIDLTREDMPSDLTKFDSAELVLVNPLGVPVADPGFQLFINDSTVEIDWPTDRSALDMSGIYVMQVTLVGEGVREQIAPVAFNVQSQASVRLPAWASVADVKAYTNKDVGQETVDMAQSVVELYVRLTPEIAAQLGLGIVDLAWLKRGVAYQAAWMETQPDFFDRSDMDAFSQDGVSVDFTNTGMTLAPLARKSLRNLGWVGGSIRLNPYIDRRLINPDYIDDFGDWKRL